VILDTSVLIAAERELMPLERFVGGLGSDVVAISAVTASELLVGVERASRTAQRVKREAFVERLLALIPVLPFGVSEARVHARVVAESLRAGRPMGAHDAIIAATALSLGWRVATQDVAAFRQVPGLDVIAA
jgi:tRNA(fMet)-specific endonuclease VapC